nr:MULTISPECIES: GNAT family N-acetyltransferase [unclassified Cryobacterium]
MNRAESPAFSGARVRRATDADAQVLHELAAATFALACPPGMTQANIDVFIAEHLSAARFREYLADPQRDLLIAEVGGQPAGYTMLVAGEPQDPDVASAVTERPTVELSKCYTLPSAHGTGTAPTLMAASVDAARARGARTVWLGVNQQNARANRFYDKSGFVVVGTKRFRVGDAVEHDFVRALTL